MKRLIVILLIALGFVFRIWIVGAFPQPFIFDQWEYHATAANILSSPNHLYTSSYRMPGYPLILALVYSIFGMENTMAWIIAQICFELITATLVYLIALKIFRTDKIALLSLFLYVVNPFTSAYVGVRLTEAVTVMLLTLVIYLVLNFQKNKNPLILIILGFLSGVLPQMRPGYLYLDILILLFLFIQMIRSQKIYKLKVVSIIFTVTLFFSTFIFNIKANIASHGQMNLMTVDNLFIREFYISLFMERPDVDVDQPQEVRQIYMEYSLGNDPDVKNTRADKYLKLAIKKVKSDPKEFILSRIRKLWYVWEKHRIFIYSEITNNTHKMIVYWTNVILLLSSLAGFLSWMQIDMRKMRGGLGKVVGGLMIFLVLYTSILHAFTITSGRFSMPVYPMIILFAGYFIWQVIAKIMVKFQDLTGKF